MSLGKIMTDFEKVKNYYKHFDEKNRLLNDNSGKLEFLMTMRILEKDLPSLADGSDISILDLGGGAGAYSFPLAKKGYKVTLADLSETLLAQAKKLCGNSNKIYFKSLRLSL